MPKLNWRIFRLFAKSLALLELILSTAHRNSFISLGLGILMTTIGALKVVGQNIPVLSDNAKISILTCGPGEELYSSFGHTAIRVVDPVLGFDYCYNYGTFNFNQPNFYLNFARGSLLYTLSVTTYKRFVRTYQRENRSVNEQYLRLDSHQRQAMFEFLEWNALPENSDYLYDYFFDNCSTRPRDVIVNTLAEALVWDTSFVDDHRSIRQLCDDYILRQQPWGDLGIDICLGSRIDRPSTAWEHTYLPVRLEMLIDSAKVKWGDSLLPLVEEKWRVVEPVPVKFETSWFAPQPVFVAILLFLAVIITFLRAGGVSVRFIEAAIFLNTGLLGILLLVLWFLTDHLTAAWNLNLVWAFPLDLAFAIVLFRKKRPGWVRSYAIFTLIVGALLLIFWGMLPQMLHYSLRMIVILKMFLALGIFRSEGMKKALQNE